MSGAGNPAAGARMSDRQGDRGGGRAPCPARGGHAGAYSRRDPRPKGRLRHRQPDRAVEYQFSPGAGGASRGRPATGPRGEFQPDRGRSRRNRTGGTPSAVFRAATDSPVPTAMGPMPIDPVLRQAMLTPRLAIARHGQFDVVQCAGAPVAADPYMTAQAARRFGPAPRAQPMLRVVK